MRRVKPVRRPGPYGGWSHSESGGLSFARSVIYPLSFLLVTTYFIVVFFNFNPSFCLLVPFLLFPFFPLPSCDLTLRCGLAVISFLCLPPSFSLLLSFDPGYFTASRGCSFPYFLFVKFPTRHIILTLVRSDFPKQEQRT